MLLSFPPQPPKPDRIPVSISPPPKCCLLSEQLRKDKTPGRRHHSTFNLGRAERGESPYCFPQRLHQFILLPTVHKDSLFSTSSPTLVISSLFDDSPSKVICSFTFLICILLMTKNIEHLFMCLLAICIPLLVKQVLCLI